MGTFDNFVAQLRCPRCQRLSSADDSTGIQTKLRDEPDASWFSVGSQLSFDLHRVAESGYLPVQPAGQPLRLLQIWSCGHCGKYPNWAEVVIQGDRVAAIEAVPLDLATLDRIHFIDEDVAYFVAAHAGRELADVPYAEIVPLLRDLLKCSVDLSSG